MSLPVKIDSALEALLFTEDDCTTYINKNTGEIASVSDEESNFAHQKLDETTPEWIVAGIPRIKLILESEEYLEMPSKYDLHEEKVMAQFCETIEKEDIKNYLLKTLSGNTAAENFNKFVDEFELHDSWASHRNNAIKQIAIDFFTKHSIPFEDK